MKPDQYSPVCKVQSFPDHAGRRTLKFTRVASGTDLARTPVKLRKSPFRLKLLMSSEAAFSFEPAIQIRTHV
jgi:hypothetical protein